MNVLAALKAYTSLSKQQKQLLQEKRLEAEYTPAEWLQLLEGLARYDAQGDRLRRVSGIGFFVLLVPTFFGFMFPPLLWVALPLQAAAGIIWLVTRRADLSNHLRLFVLPLVTLLGDDVKPGQGMRLKMDLRGGTVKDKRKGEKDPYRKGAYYKIVETWYTDPWLNADLVLADGSRLTMALTDAIRELKKTKRNARGKIKTKTKYKVKGLMDVRLKLPADRYRIPESQGPNGLAPNIQVNASGKWLGLRGRGAATRTGDKLQAPDIGPLLELVTKLYAVTERQPEEAAANV